VRGYVDFNGVLLNITGDADHGPGAGSNNSCYGADTDALVKKLRAVHKSRLGLATGNDGDDAKDGLTDDAKDGDKAAVLSFDHQSHALTFSQTPPQESARSCPPCADCPPCPVSTRATPPRVCDSTGKPPEAWGLISCNDYMKLSATQVKGVGADAMWPPSQPRGWSAATIKGNDTVMTPGCAARWAPQGLYGGPEAVHSHGDWIAAYYKETTQTR
jgi:hypothetical protein